MYRCINPVESSARLQHYSRPPLHVRIYVISHPEYVPGADANRVYHPALDSVFPGTSYSRPISLPVRAVSPSPQLVQSLSVSTDIVCARQCGAIIISLGS